MRKVKTRRSDASLSVLESIADSEGLHHILLRRYKLGHLWMAGQQASSERLLQRIQRQALAERTEWGRLRIRTCSAAADRMAHRAMPAHQIFSTILRRPLRMRGSGVHGKDCKHDTELMAFHSHDLHLALARLRADGGANGIDQPVP